jgi:transposase
MDEQNARLALMRAKNSRGIDSKERLGRHRWVVERSFAWLHGGYRRLATRYERLAEIRRMPFTRCRARAPAAW